MLFPEIDSPFGFIKSIDPLCVFLYSGGYFVSFHVCEHCWLLVVCPGDYSPLSPFHVLPSESSWLLGKDGTVLR